MTVFVSFSHDDAVAAGHILEGLAKSVQIAGWKDDADVTSTQAIGAQIRQKLSQASAVIVLVSRNALNSRWVQFEVGAAEGMGKRIIPVFIDGRGPEALPPWLATWKAMDVRGLSPERAAALIREILQQDS